MRSFVNGAVILTSLAVVVSLWAMLFAGSDAIPSDPPFTQWCHAHLLIIFIGAIVATCACWLLDQILD